MKVAQQEFKDMAVNDIMDSIGNDVDVGTKPLDAGLSNMGRVNESSTEEYGMIMTTELEGRIQTMCNLSENIKEQSIKMERLNAIERMIKAGATKEQIISFGYTKEEFAEAENVFCVNT